MSKIRTHTGTFGFSENIRYRGEAGNFKFFKTANLSVKHYNENSNLIKAVLEAIEREETKVDNKNFYQVIIGIFNGHTFKGKPTKDGRRIIDLDTSGRSYLKENCIIQTNNMVNS